MVESDECPRQLTIATTPMSFKTTPDGTLHGVHIYFEQGEDRYYLKYNRTLTLECEDTFNNDTVSYS